MHNSALHIIWLVLQLCIGYNLVFPLILYIFFLLRKLFTHTDKKSLPINTEADYGIIVTAYEQTHMLHAVVLSLLKLNYTNYIIYIVADKCDITNLQFEDNRVVVLRPEQTLASNTRSHFYAINRFVRAHERLTIIDSDNLADKEYLNQLNKEFDKGFIAVQGRRDAKNLDTTYACLDAARDIYYHFYDGKMLFEAGSSATLAGSGMAFTTQLYKDSLESLDITGAGFDKVLQYHIVNSGKRIAFAGDAIVYDEKTTHADQLVKQRARWINTWFKYFKFGFNLIGKGIVRFNWNELLFGIILLRPPLFIFLILSILFLFINLFIAPIAAAIWAAGIGLFICGFLLALAKGHTNEKIYRSLKNIPKFMFWQVMSLMKVRNANKHSVATRRRDG
ncbi:MAG: glycosyltransferase [Taibaiella sp.]|nr:glycosyltransferase [Taibaiella sp.]